jgi:hypothetical protein
MVTSTAQLWDRLKYHQVLDYRRYALISSVKLEPWFKQGAEWKAVNLDFYCPEPMVVPAHVSTKRGNGISVPRNNLMLTTCPLEPFIQLQ